jgi:hypothetical protein
VYVCFVPCFAGFESLFDGQRNNDHTLPLPFLRTHDEPTNNESKQDTRYFLTLNPYPPIILQLSIIQTELAYYELSSPSVHRLLALEYVVHRYNSFSAFELCVETVNIHLFLVSHFYLSSTSAGLGQAPCFHGSCCCTPLDSANLEYETEIGS